MMKALIPTNFYSNSHHPCSQQTNNQNNTNKNVKKPELQIIGGGIVSLYTAYNLSQSHDITIIEAEPALCSKSSNTNAGQIALNRIKHSFTFHKLPIHRVFQTGIDLKMAKWGIFNILYSYYRPEQYTNNRIYRELSSITSREFESLLENENFDFVQQKAAVALHFKDHNKFNMEMDSYKANGYKCEEIEQRENIDQYTREKKDWREGKTILDSNHYTIFPAQFNERFIQLLKDKHNVKFLQNTKVEKIETNESKVEYLQTKDGRKLKGDKYLICTNDENNKFQFSNVPTVGISSLVWTLDMTPERKSVFRAVRDLESKEDCNNKIKSFADMSENYWYVDYGDKMRVLCGYWQKPDRKQIDGDWEGMEKAFYFPMKQDGSVICTRVITPDGLPVVGKHEKYGNLYINSFYGNLGWTMSPFGGWYCKKLIEGDLDWNPLSGDRFTVRSWLTGMLSRSKGRNCFE